MDMKLPALGVLLCAFSFQASAAMRCNSTLVSEGDSTFEVQRKCGAPANREVIPAAPVTGNKPNQSVTVENWEYGPWSGAYYLLKFFDGKLVSIDMSR
ncbi:DUF2845 domain-containing protein [Pseudomonas sp. dw_358]|uniref:DUF2845 domain-containing protein n=1 Tax=Pseudomonas sp. dw_358 TaxID=2720083 RepID=UPI001BD3F73B|nr:DUF2845 domain-containing protein [Pseudomonas sp. dw_358]